MIAGEGTPLNILQAGAQSVRDLAQNASFVSRDNPSAQKKDTSGRSDVVELSREARNFLDNSRNLLQDLEKGQKAAAQSDRDFIGQRLQQVREQIEFLQNMISAATPEQAGAIMKGLEDVAGTLEKIGRQLGLSGQEGAAQGVQKAEGDSVEINALSLKASFNQTTVYETEDGERVEVSQSLDIELSFLEVKATGEQGEEVKQDSAQQSFADLAENNQGNPLFLAQLNNNQSSGRVSGRADTVTNNVGVFEAIEELSTVDSVVTGSDTVEKFSETVRGLTQTIKEFGEVFTDEERMPPSLYRIMKNLVSMTLENGPLKEDAEKVDQVA